MSFDGVASVVESTSPLCWPGPFYVREEVLALRKETAEFASRALRLAPAPVQKAARISSLENMVAEFLRAYLDRP
jgi:hypothetical protein